MRFCCSTRRLPTLSPLLPACLAPAPPFGEQCAVRSPHLYWGPLELYNTSGLGGACHNNRFIKGVKETPSAPLQAHTLRPSEQQPPSSPAHCRVPLPALCLVGWAGPAVKSKDWNSSEQPQRSARWAQNKAGAWFSLRSSVGTGDGLPSTQAPLILGPHGSTKHNHRRSSSRDSVSPLSVSA